MKKKKKQLPTSSMGRQVGQNYTDYNVIIDHSVKVFFFYGGGVGGEGLEGGGCESFPPSQAPWGLLSCGPEGSLNHCSNRTPSSLIISS